MSWFKRTQRTASGAAVSDRGAKRADLRALEDFGASRSGVEAFVEPATTSTQLTVLLVAADGEWTRRRVASPKAASQLAATLGIPLYDVNRVGYPQRMREYNARIAGRARTSPHSAPTASKRALTPAQYAAMTTLESVARSAALGRDPSRAELEKVLRAARANAHPDRLGGDRTQWDKVEDAARQLGLS